MSRYVGTIADFIGVFTIPDFRVAFAESSMQTVHLIRGFQDDTVTFGRLYVGGSGYPVCCTVELPWLDNRRSVSCIPLGGYVARRVRSAKFGDTFSVSVPGRSGVLFHAGNRPADSKGCILPVRDVFYPPQGPYGKYSKAAMAKFMKLLDGVQSFRLCVTSVLPVNE